MKKAADGCALSEASKELLFSIIVVRLKNQGDQRVFCPWEHIVYTKIAQKHQG